MSKKLSEEEFQGFVVEQFGKLATELTEVRTELAEVGTELSSVRTDVTSLQASLAGVRVGLADVRAEMQTGFRELRAEIIEIKEVLEPLVKAFDNDAQKIVEHDRRIERLETHVGIPRTT